MATAVVLLYLVAVWAYVGAAMDGVLTVSGFVLSIVFAAALLASPIVMIKIKHWKMFDYASMGSRES